MTWMTGMGKLIKDNKDTHNLISQKPPLILVFPQNRTKGSIIRHMTIARAQQIDLSVTPYYHCINRCVRRAFLCGVDDQTGISYEHRRGWISDKIKALSETFAIDVAAYAVMSNHYHIVLRIDQEQAESWTPLEVIERWNTFFTLPVLITRFMKDDAPHQLN